MPPLQCPRSTTSKTRSSSCMHAYKPTVRLILHPHAHTRSPTVTRGIPLLTFVAAADVNSTTSRNSSPTFLATFAGTSLVAATTPTTSNAPSANSPNLLAASPIWPSWAKRPTAARQPDQNKNRKCQHIQQIEEQERRGQSRTHEWILACLLEQGTCGQVKRVFISPSVCHSCTSPAAN